MNRPSLVSCSQPLIVDIELRDKRVRETDRFHWRYGEQESMNELPARVQHSRDSECRKHYGLLRWFIFTSAAILFLTAMAKIWAACGSAKILALEDPIIGISFRHLILAASILELIVSVVCIVSKSQKLALGLIAWLTTNFLAYRIGVWWVGWHRPCGCLGNLTDTLHVRPELAENGMKIVLAYLLLGSYGLLIWQRRLLKANA
jgi:hypothetical protein